MGKGWGVRPNETKAHFVPCLGESESKFHNLEHEEALERRQRKVLIKISNKIGTMNKIH